MNAEDTLPFLIEMMTCIKSCQWVCNSSQSISESQNNESILLYGLALRNLRYDAKIQIKIIANFILFMQTEWDYLLI